MGIWVKEGYRIPLHVLFRDLTLFLLAPFTSATLSILSCTIPRMTPITPDEVSPQQWRELYWGEFRSLPQLPQKHIPLTLKSKLNSDQRIAEPNDRRAPSLLHVHLILFLPPAFQKTTSPSGLPKWREDFMARTPKTRLLGRGTR
jgi:hypothetical protein